MDRIRTALTAGPEAVTEASEQTGRPRRNSNAINLARASQNQQRSSLYGKGACHGFVAGAWCSRELEWLQCSRLVRTRVPPQASPGVMTSAALCERFCVMSHGARACSARCLNCKLGSLRILACPGSYTPGTRELCTFSSLQKQGGAGGRVANCLTRHLLEPAPTVEVVKTCSRSLQQKATTPSDELVLQGLLCTVLEVIGLCTRTE